MFYIYPTHISLHLITSHTSMSYINMSNINTQQTAYIHYFKDIHQTFYQFQILFPPNWNAKRQLHCWIALHPTKNWILVLFVWDTTENRKAPLCQRCLFSLIDSVDVVKCPATVWSNAGICTILIDGNMTLPTRAKNHLAKIQKWFLIFVWIDVQSLFCLHCHSAVARLH